MRERQTFKIATEFSVVPGPRYIKEGPFSAELLLDTKLYSLMQNIIDKDQILVIDLDGTKGYATSFLEMTFGSLARKHKPKKLLEHLEIVSLKKPFYKDEALEYIHDVDKE